MNKFITVDYKKTDDMLEDDLEGLYDFDDSDEQDFDEQAPKSLTVTTHTLQNYGCFFEKEIPLH